MQARNTRFVRIWMLSQNKDRKFRVCGFTPHQLLIDLSYAKPERALELVFLIAAGTMDRRHHSMLGGGPLLNILWQNGSEWALDNMEGTPTTLGLENMLREVLSYSTLPLEVKKRAASRLRH
jgi:hypothetical protein